MGSGKERTSSKHQSQSSRHHHDKKKKKRHTKSLPVSHHEEHQQQTKIKKPRRFRPGTVALREIFKQRKVTRNVIPMAVFTRLMRNVIDSIRDDLGINTEFRCSEGAKYALRECVQKFCTDVLTGANAITLEQGKQTVDCKAIKMAFTNNNVPSRLTCPPYARQDFDTKMTSSICVGVEPHSMHF